MESRIPGQDRIIGTKSTMTRPRFSIGIDLGTTNSALAFMPLDGEANPRSLAYHNLRRYPELRKLQPFPRFFTFRRKQLPSRCRAEPVPGRNGLSAASREERLEKPPAGSSIPQSPGFATIAPIVQRAFCRGG